MDNPEIEFRGKKYAMVELEDLALETFDKKTRKEIIQSIAQIDPLWAEKLKTLAHYKDEERKIEKAMLKEDEPTAISVRNNRKEDSK